MNANNNDCRVPVRAEARARGSKPGPLPVPPSDEEARAAAPPGDVDILSARINWLLQGITSNY